jgi:hypothetical protein
MALPPARYLFLAVPVLVLLVLIGDADARMPEEVMPFFALILMGLVMAPLNNTEGVKDLYLAFCGLCIAFLKDWPKVRLWHIMLALTTAFLVLNGITGGFTTRFHFDVMNSYSSLEGSSSFVFAILVPLAVMRKRYFLALLALALTILTLKRIAILGAGAGIFFALLGERRGKYLLTWPVMLLANVVALGTIMAYSSGAFDTLIADWTGQSANQFGQGRYALQLTAVKEITAEPWKFILGQGAGAVYDMTHVSIWTEAEKILLHCDSLKILYEFGAIFWILFFWAMYRVKSYAAKVGFVVVNFIILTDNVLSYNFFIYYFLIMVHAFKVEASSSK